MIVPCQNVSWKAEFFFKICIFSCKRLVSPCWQPHPISMCMSMCSEINKLWGRTTVRGYTSWWKTWETWPLWNRGKWLLSKIVKENAPQKSNRYWTGGQNTALSCTTTRPMEIHQYWTVPRQTQKMTTPSFTERLRLQYNHWRKGSQLESTTSQQKWSNSKQVERM